MIFAGSDTVGNTCAVTTFHVLNNKNICATLVKELANAWPEKDTPIAYETLEKLPYLVSNQLRISI